MTTISERLRLGLWLVWLIAGTALADDAAAGDDVVDVQSLTMTGLERTNPQWLEGYVDYSFPSRISRSETQALARKLMTTGVFTDVKVTLDPTQVAPQLYTLHVHVEEKWTTIPVIRGVYGGGTPLRIFGVYDTHVLGSLLTLGGEVRKYGEAPAGYVIYARDPRSQSGRYYLGAEFWRDFRRRQLLGRDGDVLGAVSTNAAISRVRMLTPFSKSDVTARDFRWKYGFDLELIQEAPSVFDPGDDALTDLPPSDLDFADGKRRQARILPTVLYDDVDVSIIENDGFRMKVKAGPTFASGKTHGSAEVELYGYKLLPASFNLATHAVIGTTSFSSLQSQYFLGGLDSVRGIPDGAIYGTHAAYANFELRHLTYKTKYLWLQSVAFADAGGAAPSWSEAGDDVRSAYGAGLRFAVPQIYRMIFRIDYAWTADGSGMKGVTAGMNQFFDPYTPL